MCDCVPHCLKNIHTRLQDRKRVLKQEIRGNINSVALKIFIQ